MKLFRLPAILIVVAALLAAVPAGASASSSIVECGQIVAYTAPDPGTPADGSLTLGQLDPWVIDANATVGSSAAAVLPSFAGSGPSCLALDLDDGGVITALDFASQGTLTGPVVVDSGFDGFIFDDRLLIPTFITDAYPGLAAVFITSAAAHTVVTATFFVDTSSGQFTGFNAEARFCGAGDLAGNGDGLVGAAVIPAAVLDPGDSAVLAAADLERVCALVSAVGSIDGSGITINTDVEIAALPNTATDPGPVAKPAAAGDYVALIAAFLVLIVCRAALARRRYRGVREAR
jgi:hypothetical protein